MTKNALQLTRGTKEFKLLIIHLLPELPLSTFIAVTAVVAFNR